MDGERTAGEVSHYGACRSGGIGLILRFVPLGKCPATSSRSGAGSCSSSIAGVDASPETSSSSNIAGVDASPETSSRSGAGSCSSIAGVDASPAWKLASHIRTATTTSCSDNSSSFAGRGTARSLS
ncbi:hypothetical protein PF002_g10140 [Phytophthora fragariae]|uniref:Uncharacterized protein n=1 Tax=Phytophthora fragariae TaxID=53985 RepID=A0A6A3S4V6_9STRA|nr:hypothetical protein PF007_g13346 [Phytophthora fragariae]KAE9239705.1 hypothetical protein PF002_g10140 [Phytophthora fragariae]